MDILKRSEAAQLIKKYKLIGFGAGVIGAKSQRFLDGKLSYFLDNEEEKWGKKWEGIPVKPLSALDDEDISSVVIVVCTEQYQIIEKQVLSKYPDAKLLRSPLLKEYEIFDALLNCSEKILVSSYGANGGIYLVNGRTEKYDLLKQGSFRGLLHFDNRLIVATEKGELWEIESLLPFKYKVKYSPDSISQMHGLAYWKKENVIIAAEAEHDRISFIDANQFRNVNQISIRGNGGSDISDACHVNDLHIKDDILFISMISRSGWWKHGIYDGSICELNLNNMLNITSIINNLLFPHSIKFIGDQFIILEAMNGKVVSGSREVILQLNGYLRGLDGNENLLYIGQSRNRRVKEATKYHSPISMDSGIYISNLDSKVFRFIKLPEMCDVYNILDLENLNIPLINKIYDEQ